ncbi:MAG TPA: fibronectin type III domain-containing protein [Pyrinomonadaceae bacterium]|nr:fibronectin type III domain-containing protein [Pyrinomonadaceae bacterium]
MAKVKLNFRRLSVPEKVAKARQIVTALTGNASFPNPIPPLETLTASLNALEGAYRTTRSRRQAVKTAVDDQTMREDALIHLMSQCASYVESIAGNDRSLITSAGMDPRAPASASTMPDVPSGLEATVGDRDGEIDLSWDPARGVRSYVIQQSTDPPSATTWTHAATSTKSSATITGLMAGTRYWFRVAAIGAIGQSGWSDPATKIAP